jgi:HPr kinase/phosphorylase
MARLVEVAALTQALKKTGHDPAKDFNDRLIQFMAQQAAVPEKTIRLGNDTENPNTEERER